MRRVFSELILKPSLVVCVIGGLSACSNKAFQSAVYTDPGREKHLKKSSDVESTSSAQSNKSRWEKKLKKRGSPSASADKESVEIEAPRVLETPTVETTTSDFETRRSRARQSTEIENTEVVKSAQEKTTVDSSHPKKPIELDFTTESVDGINSASVLKNLTGVANLSTDSTANLESLNQGSFRIELTARDDMNDRYSAVAALTFIIQTQSDDPALDSNEVTKTLRLTNLGNVIKSAKGYEALLKYGSKKFLRVKISSEGTKKPRSGEIFLVEDDGSERKILTLIQEN